MQLSTNFTTIFLAKSPRARGAWVPGCRRRLLLQGWALHGASAHLGPATSTACRVGTDHGAPASLGAGCRGGRRWTRTPATERLTSKPQRSTITRFTCRFIHRTMVAGCIWVSFPSERTAMDNRIGAVVARERKALGLTQEELARRLGVTKAAVSKWGTEGV